MAGSVQGERSIEGALALLEPSALACRGEDRVALSVAISLKRIADQFERLDAIVDWNRNEPYGPAVRTQPGEMRD